MSARAAAVPMLVLICCGTYNDALGQLPVTLEQLLSKDRVEDTHMLEKAETGTITYSLTWRGDGGSSASVITGSTAGQLGWSGKAANPNATGMLSISAPLALGAAEVFTLTGSDARVSGVGTISLVAGGLSNRAVSGPNANRGWLNLTIGSPLGALPSMNGWCS